MCIDAASNEIVYAVKTLRVYERDPVETVNKVWNFFIQNWIEG